MKALGSQTVDPIPRLSASGGLEGSALDGATVTLALEDGEFESGVTASQVTVSGRTGVGVRSVTRDTATQLTVTLSYNGETFTSRERLLFEVAAAAVKNHDVPLQASLRTVSKPTVTITSGGLHPTKDPFEVTIEFSSAVTGFEAEDVVVANGTATGFTGTRARYRITIMPDVDYEGAVTVSVSSGAATEENGVGNTEASAKFLVDTRTPVLLALIYGKNTIRNTLVLNYDEALNTRSVPVGTAFTVRVNGSAVNLSGATPVNVAGKTVTLNLAAPVANGAAATVSYAAPTAENAAKIQDAAGNPAAAFAAVAVSNDTEKPTVTITSGATHPTKDAFTVTLTFSAAVADFVVGDITVTKGAASDFTATPAATVFTVTVTPDSDYAGDVTVAVAADVATANGVGNAAAAQTFAADTKAPALASATVAGTTLTLTYDETLGAATPDASAFAVRAGADAANLSPVSLAATTPVTVAGTTVTLTLSSAVANGAAATVSYAAPPADNQKIQDAAGNPAAAFANETVSDAAAPVLQSASVRGNALTLTYDEALNERAGATPAPGAFAVTSDTAAATPASRVAVSGTTVALTLNRPVAATETVTVSYTVPTGAGAAKIQDVAANPAAAFAAVAVSNDTEPQVVRVAGPDGEYIAGDIVPIEVTFSTAVEVVNPKGAPVRIGLDTGGVATLVSGSGSTQLIFDYEVRQGDASDDLQYSPAVIVLPIFGSVAIRGTTDSVDADLTLPPLGDLNSLAGSSEIVVDTTKSRIFSVAAAQAVEGDHVVFEVTLERAGRPRAVTVNYLVNSFFSGDTATAAVDYTAVTTPGTLSFAADETTKDLVVPTIEDTAVESDETFTVTLQGASAGSRISRVDRIAKGTIVDDDGPPRVLISSTATFPTQDAFSLTIVFTRAVTGFGLSDVAVTKGTASRFEETVSGTTWSVTMTPDANYQGDVTVEVAADAAVDGNGVGNVARSARFAVDTLAPTVLEAEFAAATLMLTYDEDLHEDSTPAASAFLLRAGPDPESLASVELADTDPVTVLGQTVLLTLARAVGVDDAVTVSYAPPATNPIRDPLGNSAAGFTDEMVSYTDVLISNLSQAVEANIVIRVGPSGTSHHSRAIKFTTGGNDSGYLVSEVFVNFVGGIGAGVVPRLSIYTADQSGFPGTRMYVFTNPDTLTSASELTTAPPGQNTFSAPDNAVLQKDTSYFLVMESLVDKVSQGDSRYSFSLAATKATTADPIGAFGWSIGEQQRRSNDAENWEPLVTSSRPMFAINGVIPGSTVVGVSGTDGTYIAGDTAAIAVTFASLVDVSGVPRLTLETGETDRAATYATGSGTATLTFHYTVAAGMNRPTCSTRAPAR